MRPDERISFRRKQDSSRRYLCFKFGLVLNSLVEEILSGNTTKLGDFQQLLQYAPENMRSDLLDKLDRLKLTGAACVFTR